MFCPSNMLTVARSLYNILYNLVHLAVAMPHTILHAISRALTAIEPVPWQQERKHLLITEAASKAAMKHWQSTKRKEKWIRFCHDCVLAMFLQLVHSTAMVLCFFLSARPI